MKMSNNKTFETLQEEYKHLTKIETLNEYVAFCKYTFKPKDIEKLGDFLEIENVNSYKKAKLKDDNKQLLKDAFPYLWHYFNNESDIANFIKKYKSNDPTKDFSLAFLKDKVLKPSSKIFKINNSENNPDNPIQKIQNISGIITDESNIKNLIEKLPKYSFAVWVKFQLLGPYFSKDDDEFYIIQNPVLKEHVFKMPMVRGSSWKGALAVAFKKLLNEKDNNTKNENNNTKIIESYLRIFGAGSENIKVIESYLKEKSKDLKNFKENVLEFILFELGMSVDSETTKKITYAEDENDLLELLKNKISDKFRKSQSNLPIEFQTHKGRAIFYPTYFDKISLEIINPHDRKKRTGTSPIHYEVVPKYTEGILQIVYIPFDGVLKRDDELGKEVEKDLELLCKAIEILSDEGIGAKTKLGWGRFEIEKKCFFMKDNDNLQVQEWEKCQT